MITTTSGERKPCLSLRELRAVAQPPEYSPARTDALYRACSIFVSLPLARLGATPNGITVAWILLGLAGVAGVAGNGWTAVAGALLLQLSYLLDFVDGEVARLTGLKSQVGEFLDVLGHGLMKTAIPFAIGTAAAASTGEPAFVLLGGIGAVALGIGDALRFYAACISGNLATGDLGHTVAPRGGNHHSVGWQVGAVFKLTFESPGIYALVLVGAVAGRFDVLAVYYALGGIVWFYTRARCYVRRFARP